MVGLATKTFTKPLLRVSREDEAGMLFRGFLAFLDPPKESAIPCIKTLYGRGVSIKVGTDSIPLLACHEAELICGVHSVLGVWGVSGG